MCGILGAIGLRAVPTPQLADRILDAIRHRGPDASGSTFVDGVWLASRRLKILDLRDDANQPMRDEATGVVLVFNGEIYNYIELREELAARGRSFATTGDTEVLLNGYLEWGDDLFDRCDGMWAVAIHDPRRGGLLLSRDRFGEKPLFVGRDRDGAWWFGSEPHALRLAGAGTGRLNRRRTLNFLAFGDSEDPTDSFYEGISQLPPGCSALLTSNGLGELRRWFDLASLLGVGQGAPPADEEIQAAIDLSVRRRLRSDVAVGSSLSGGVDSSTIVAAIRQSYRGDDLHVFTASFPGTDVDEWLRANKVAERFGARAHAVEPTAAGFLEALPALALHQGGPFDSPSVYAQWCVMRRAAEEGVVVLLDGQGADETWGGYRKYVWFAVASALRSQPRAAARVIRAWRAAEDLPRPDVEQIAALALPPAGRRAALTGLRARLRWAGSAFDDVSLGDPQGDGPRGSLLRRAAFADTRRVMLPRLLRYADRNSMAWSRELRLPFLDPAVVRLGWRAGWLRGFERGWTKERLRGVAANRVPSEIAWRRAKTAYDIPDAAWLSTPVVEAAVGDAYAALRADGLLAPGALVPPWRALSLGAFIEHARLTP